MTFTREEKKKLLEYVADSITKECGITINESRNIVKNSMLVNKIDTAPFFVSHCSIGQLSDMIKKEKNLVCI